MQIAVLVGLSLVAAPAIAAPAPRTAPAPVVGQCFATTVKHVESRLQGDPTSGSAMVYGNGIHQTSYDVIPGMASSRDGDPIQMCVVQIPRGCPKGDTRGIVYRAMNVRTGLAWRAADSEHECGGA